MGAELLADVLKVNHVRGPRVCICEFLMVTIITDTYNTGSCDERYWDGSMGSVPKYT